MSEIWIQAKVYPNLGRRDDLLFEFIAPAIEEFKDKINTFHFIFYGEHHMYLRLREKSDNQSIVRSEFCPWFIDSLEKLQNKGIVTRYCVSCWQGESENFGDKGWQLLQVFLENVSKMTLLKRQTERVVDRASTEEKKRALERCQIHDTNRFHEAKLVHLLLLTFGYDTLREIEFYFSRTGVHYDKKELMEILRKRQNLLE